MGDIFQGDSDMDGRWDRKGSGFIEARRGVWVLSCFLFVTALRSQRL